MCIVWQTDLDVLFWCILLSMCSQPAFLFIVCFCSYYLVLTDYSNMMSCLRSYIRSFGAKYCQIQQLRSVLSPCQGYCLLTKCSSPSVKTCMQNEYDIVCHSLLMVTHTALSGKVQWHCVFMTCIHACIITPFTALPSDLGDNDQFKM